MFLQSRVEGLFENVVEKGENVGKLHLLHFTQVFQIVPKHVNPYMSHFMSSANAFNPLPDMQILDYSNSTANKDMMSKMWTNGDTDI